MGTIKRSCFSLGLRQYMGLSRENETGTKISIFSAMSLSHLRKSTKVLKILVQGHKSLKSDVVGIKSIRTSFNLDKGAFFDRL